MSNVSSPSQVHYVHLEAEKGVKPFSYDKTQGRKVGGGVKEFVTLGATPHLQAMVQIVKEGGENNLHFHTKTDQLYMVLKGRVRFHGPGDKIYGEFGQYEGIVIPADSRYWFETLSAEPLEVLQVLGFTGDARDAKRVNAEAAKPWMAGRAELQVYDRE